MRIIKIAFQWLQANRVMLTNTGSLVGTTAVTSGLGFAYWWLAARRFTPTEVGLASVTVSTMVLLGSIGMLGMGTLLITELPRQPGQEASLIGTGVVVAGGTGGVIGLLFAVFAPSLFPQFAPLRATVLNIVAFSIGVGLSAATSVLDQALIGILQGNLQFWRNAFFSAAKLILLFAATLYLSHTTGMTIYMAWAVSMGLSVVLLFVYMVSRRGWRSQDYLPRWTILRKLGLAALQHHLLNIVLQVPVQILPLVVATMLSVQAAAWFYVSWMLANFVFVVPSSITMVLHAMNSADHASLKYRARITISISFAVSLAAIGAVFLGTKQILGLFGSSYAEHATWSLRLFVLVVFPTVIGNHYISFCRIQDRVNKAIISMIIGGILELGCAMIGAYVGGLTGLCGGWLIAAIIQGLYMSPLVYKVLWPAKDALAVPLPENTSAEVYAIWQMDTIAMPAIPLRQITAGLRLRMPVATLREAEPLWLVDTTKLPVAEQSLPPLQEHGSPPFTRRSKSSALVPTRLVSTNTRAFATRPRTTNQLPLVWQQTDSSYSQLGGFANQDSEAEQAQELAMRRMLETKKLG